MVWFDPTIIDAFRNLLPGLDDFFFWVSQLGGDVFYIVLLLVLYWGYNKKDVILAAYVFLVTLLVNFWLKMLIAKDRPPSSYWHTSADPPNYSTPSGHSQYSATLYGWFTVKVKTWWVALIGTILTVMIGLSRIYVGVHFLEDVLIGWGIGIIIVVIFFYLERPAREFLSQYNTEHLLIAMMIVGFLMTIFSAIIPQPPNDNFGAYGGFTMGLPLGLILERRFVDFSNETRDGKKWRLALRIVIGLVLVIGVMGVLGIFLPSELIWLRTLRYFLVSLTGIFIWPAIFKRVDL